MAKKKTNPRRIPLAKKEINKDEILHEATQGKMDDAWILVEDAYGSGYDYPSHRVLRGGRSADCAVSSASKKSEKRKRRKK